MNIDDKMTRETREKRCEVMLMAGIQKLLMNQDFFSIEDVTVKVLEILMLLERASYLKGTQGCNDIGNGTYPQSLKH